MVTCNNEDCLSDDLDLIDVENREEPQFNYFTVGIYKCKFCGQLTEKTGVEPEIFEPEAHELTDDEITEEYRKQIEGF